ncbi:MAG: SIS domain-containing protein, partial [Desulfobacterales bacterium]|nr:SIS domain-containing protein [Desulfobacterales bacterium]
NRVKKLFSTNIELGQSIKGAKENSIIFFPYQPNTVACGISAFVAFKGNSSPEHFNLNSIQEMVLSLKTKKLSSDALSVRDDFPGSDDLLNRLFEECKVFKQEKNFSDLFFNKEKQRLLLSISETIEQLIKDQTSVFKKESVNLSSLDIEIISLRLEKLKDIWWCLKKEILYNITAISNLAMGLESSDNVEGLKIFKRINTVLNSIDRLEVRGRDSAGISVILTFTKPEFEKFRQALIKAGLSERFKQRTNHLVLSNNSLTINDTFPENGKHFVTISFVYKFAAEIGALGDNVSFIRSQIKNDLMLQLLSNYHFVANSVSAHTRWASVGDITLANCHPQDNTPADRKIGRTGILHVCLNGDIDNYLELKTEYEARYDKIHEDINTDTKLIPLQIEHYLKLNNSIEEAFRLAVNDFEGSHAISMHSNLAPGKLFLAQKGSGQAIFVGIAEDHYIAASELYGIVEETQDYIKLNGENKGQIVILDPDSSGGVSGIQSFYYDNTPVSIEDDQIRTSQITSRDIDRQNFPHYFLKEISESPGSVEKTLEDKINFSPESNLFSTSLDETVIPKSLEDSFKNNRIKKVYFIGQGTAGIAAQGCADLLNFYLGDIDIDIRALKSSELSGFSIIEGKNKAQSMANTLVVAISQSGTTTDTNRTVDLVKGCGAKTLAIVNRRDSDLTFKTDGVLYTSSGRDIEMSVASTKAFYSQITAGAILGLHIARIAQTRSSIFITEQINEIISLPDKMRIILDMKDQIKDSAFRLAVSKDYWATVGSGSNKTSADEIRIKLSE